MEYSFSPWFWHIYYYYHDLNNPHFQILTLYLRIETHKLQIFPIFTSSEDSNLRNLQKLFPHAAVFFFPTCRGFFPTCRGFFPTCRGFYPTCRGFSNMQRFLSHMQRFFPTFRGFFPDMQRFLSHMQRFFPHSEVFFPLN